MASEGSPVAVAVETEADPKDALIEALMAENAWLRTKVSWGLVQAGDAYKDRAKIDKSKPRVEALDIPPVTAQLPDD